MNSYYFIFSEADLLLQRQPDGTFTIPCCEQVPVKTGPQTHIMDITPMEDGTPVKTLDVGDKDHIDVTLPALQATGYEFTTLRESFYSLSTELYLKAGKCRELLYWDQKTRYCGVCGMPMHMHTAISKRCPNCGNEVWPQLATAIIVLIKRGDEVLLVHARNFKSDFYGLVAGFVETGETLEEAVRREVMEETGLTIDNISYFGSQPWPYPCGLMIGFNADYVAGDIHLQEEELSKGNWFHYSAMPHIPQRLSIARRLIDAWLATHGVVSEQR